MKLRWLVIHYGNGVKSTPELQYYDVDTQSWERVTTFETDEASILEAEQDPSALGD